MLKKILIITAAILASSAFARIDVQCKVDGLERSVQFMTGRELNGATRSYSYNNFSAYALLWYSQDQVAILEHTGYSGGMSGSFTATDLSRIFLRGQQSFRHVNGNSRRTVRIECKSFGRWIDPKLR